MKKIICLTLALLMVVALAASGNFDQKVYFVGTWTCETSADGRVPASKMTIQDDYTGVLEYGDMTYTFKWVNHPANPEVLLVKEMVDESGATHVPTEKLYRCPNCYLETRAIKVVDNTCPRENCGTKYTPECEVANVISCTYTIFEGRVRMLVADGDGLDKIEKMNMMLDKLPK